MSKNKSRNKENYNQPGEQGFFYDSKKCFVCGKLIWGSSPKSHSKAKKDCYFKMKSHQEEHQKEKQVKQLNLSIPGTEEKQSESIKIISLRGEQK